MTSIFPFFTRQRPSNWRNDWRVEVLPPTRLEKPVLSWSARPVRARIRVSSMW